MPNTPNHSLPWPEGTDAAVVPADLEDLATAVDTSLDHIAPGQIVGVTAGRLLIANGSGVVTGVAISGDGTVSSTGVLAIGESKIGSAQIAPGAITTPKIANSAINEDKIQNGQVSEAKIANGHVTNGKIADNAVTADKIAAGAVGSSELADGAATTDKIPDGALTRPKMAAGFIQTERQVVSLGANSLAEVTITWTNAFPNTSYTPVVSVLEGGNAFLYGLQITDKSATAIKVVVVNNSDSTASGTVNAIAIVD